MDGLAAWLPGFRNAAVRSRRRGEIGPGASIHLPDHLRPLFPADAINRARSDFPPPDEGVARHGVIYAIDGLLLEVDGIPLVLVELGFFPPGELPEPLSPESWDSFRDQTQLPVIGPRDALRPLPPPRCVIEFAPLVVIRDIQEHFQFRLPPPDQEWEAMVRRLGRCTVVIGTGMGYSDGTDQQALAIPASCSSVLAEYRGSFSVPLLTDIPGLHVIPLSGEDYDPLTPATYLLDTDVLIDIERFCYSPASLGHRLEPVRQLLINVVDRDVLPGLALSQLHQPSRRRSDARAARRAAAAFIHVMSWERQQIALHHFASDARSDPSSTELTGPGNHPSLLALYAGVLHLRSLWNPGQSLAARVSAFNAYMTWLRDDLQLTAIPLFQVALNLFVSAEPAHRQAARLLRFRAGSVSTADIDRLWGTAFDLFMLSGGISAIQEDDVVQLVLLTFDSGLAQMHNFMRHIGIGEIPVEGSEPRFGFVVASRLDLHPRLGFLRPEITHLMTELQYSIARRAEQGQTLDTRADEMELIAQKEERRLLASRNDPV